MTVRHARRFSDLSSLSSFSLSPSPKRNPKSPTYILNAHTVCVIIDPDAGTSLSDPLANKTAQDEVEKALMKWARFQLVQEPGRADLVIVIRKGANKPVDRTIGNLPTNDRPVTVQQTDNAIRIGGQQGRAPGSPQPNHAARHPPRTANRSRHRRRPRQLRRLRPRQRRSSAARPAPQTRDRNIGCRAMGKNSSSPPTVPAVSDFRKAIEETEKQNQQQPKETLAGNLFVSR